MSSEGFCGTSTCSPDVQLLTELALAGVLFCAVVRDRSCERERFEISAVDDMFVRPILYKIYSAEDLYVSNGDHDEALGTQDFLFGLWTSGRTFMIANRGRGRMVGTSCFGDAIGYIVREGPDQKQGHEPPLAVMLAWNA